VHHRKRVWASEWSSLSSSSLILACRRQIIEVVRKWGLRHEHWMVLYFSKTAAPAEAQ
jgi:hypothetical protein